ncbi:MAG: sulfate permease [Chloroflexi bacterium]|nr:sulfate permease [Chloroflexota bacterium]
MDNKTNPRPSLLVRYLPILDWLPKYQRTWLRTDLIAGLTVVALLIPEGMAYAQIAGMPPQTAFYAAPIGLLAFAIFGTSRQLVVAVSAVIATMSFATVSLIAAPETPEFILLTAALAILAGVISILAGFLKLGRIAQFFSESVLTGFITGLALVIMVKQVPKLLGIEGGQGNFWERLYEIIIHLPETSLPTLITGVLCLVLLIALEHYFHKIPAALVALVFGILISIIFGLEARGVEIVGEIPAGLAPPKWPAVGLQNWWLLFPGALGLALVNFAEAIGPSRSFAATHKYKMDPNQELIGLGAANFGAGLFQGFPIGSSLSKSAANDRAGAHSQMSAIIAAAVTVIVALFFTQFFYALPEAVLGAIVIVAVSGMVKLGKIKRLSRVRQSDFVLAIVALLAVMTFETLEALLISVIVSLFALVLRTSQPGLAVLGRVPGRLIWNDIRRYPENQTIPGLLMVRPLNVVFFANAEGFREAIITEMTSSPVPIKAVCLDLGATTDLDVPGADMLTELAEDLHRREIRLMLMHVITPVRQMLDKVGAINKIGPENLFIGPPEAVLEYLSSQSDAAGILELLRSGASSAVTLLQAGMSTAPADRQAELAAIVESLEKEIT